MIAPFTIFTVILIPRLKGTGGITEGFISSSFVETILARPLIYPFVFPWYQNLSNLISIIIFVLIIIFSIWSYKKSVNPEAKKLIIFISISTIIYDLITIANRPRLTSLLRDYQTTFPDRYFMGINVLILFLMVICISQIWADIKWKSLSLCLISSLSIIYLLHVEIIFDLPKSKMPIKSVFDFPEQICKSILLQDKKDLSLIEIYPEPWTITVQNRYVRQNNCKIES